MTRIIGVFSGKGGVGKTTFSVNLSVSLVKLGKEVILVDGNLTTPNVSLHLGLPLNSPTLHDVLKGKCEIEDTIIDHKSGLKIVPSGISLEHLKDVDPKKLTSIILELVGKSDYIIIDGAAGLGKEAITGIQSSDEVIVVSTPELPALADALKTIKIAKKVGTRVLGIVLNRVEDFSKINVRSIENMLETRVLGIIPEDSAVKKSISMKIPVVLAYPNSDAAKEIFRIAKNIEGVVEEFVQEVQKEEKRSFLRRILSWFK